MFEGLLRKRNGLSIIVLFWGMSRIKPDPSELIVFCVFVRRTVHAGYGDAACLEKVVKQ